MSFVIEYKGKLQKIKDKFKSLIDIEFMQRIGDKYGGKARPSGFNLHIYVDKKRESDYDYAISSLIKFKRRI